MQKSTFSGIEFDLIIISHVLEHVSDPIKFLLIARKKLKYNGYLYVEVPDIQRPKLRVLYSSFFASPHLFLFSSRTLRIILSKAGLKVIAAGNSERGLRILAKKDEFKSEFDFTKEGDDYKKIFNKISKYRIKHFFTISSKKHAKKIIKNFLVRVFGQSRAQNIITLLKNGRYKKEKNYFDRRKEKSN